MLLLIALLGCAPSASDDSAAGDPPRPPADVLLVVDNSTSMVEESTGLAVVLDDLVTGLASRSPGSVVALTTVDAGGVAGQVGGLRSTADGAEGIRADLLCTATCIPDVDLLGNDPSYLCGEPIGDPVSVQYMECTCGAEDNWLMANCGSAQEEGLEAAFLALCRAVDDPPAPCLEPVERDGASLPALLTEADVGTNDGLVAPGSRRLVVGIITDEGDDSRRQQGQDPTSDVYRGLFALFGVELEWVVFGPALDDAGDPVCPGPATAWGSQRYQDLVVREGGRYVPITTDGCDAADASAFVDAVLEVVGS